MGSMTEKLKNNIQKIAMQKKAEDKDEIIELLEEIKAICVGADSPDAIKNGEENAKDELKKCREDISAISNIVEKIQEKLQVE